MTISIFTPSHKPKYIKEAYESIKDQPFDEWVILLNGEALGYSFDFGFNDPRVKIHYAPKEMPPFVGALKREACRLCTGDLLLELDHDDLLMPGAIEKVRSAFEDPEIGFVYSNSIRLNMDGTRPEKWSGLYGWRYRNATVNGKPADELLSFAPTPATVSRIWFAPDHLRAFRKPIYDILGGHNPNMRVLDDQDLMARMYCVTKFKHLDEPLYVFRIHGENIWLQHNEEIQKNVMPMYDHYIEQLCLRWAELGGLLKLDLGGRLNRQDRYQSVDLKDADIIADLNGRWPFEDNSVGVVRASDVIEHLHDKVHTMKEIYRVLAPGGYALIRVPSTDGRGAYQDPTHVSYWNENSFLYYTDQRWGQYIDSPVRFQALRLYTGEKNAEGVCWTIAHLMKLTDGFRVPGLVNI